MFVCNRNAVFFDKEVEHQRQRILPSRLEIFWNGVIHFSVDIEISVAMSREIDSSHRRGSRHFEEIRLEHSPSLQPSCIPGTGYCFVEMKDESAGSESIKFKSIIFKNKQTGHQLTVECSEKVY